MKKRIALLVVVVFLLGLGTNKNVEAADHGSLVSCTISLSPSANGVRVTCVSTCTSDADEIGVIDVVLQEKKDGRWTNININGGYESNATTYSGTALYTGAVKGRTYRAYCTHYAKFGSTTQTLKNETDELVYN